MILRAFLSQQFLPIHESRCKDINTWITGIICIDGTLLALCCIKCHNKKTKHLFLKTR